MFSLAVDKWLVVGGQHHHVLRDAKQRILDRALLYQSEEHSRYVSLPGDLVVLLKDLKSQVASEFGRLVSNCRLRLLMNRVNHSEKVRVYLAESNQVLAREFLGQVGKDF